MNSITLQWLSFAVNLAQINTYLKANCSSNYDGLVADPDVLLIMFKATVIDADNTIVQNYWNGLTSTSFNPTQSQLIQTSLNNAVTFCQQLMMQFMVENVQLGITQAGKAGALIDYFHDVIHSFLSGSVYEAITQIDGYIADTSTAKANLSPFITNDRMTTYKNKIQTYLGIPLT